MKSLKTYMAVNRRRQVFIGKEVEELHPLEVAGVLLHEAFHLLLGLVPGEPRHGNLEAKVALLPLSLRHKLANLAADLAINSILTTFKVRLPENGVFPEVFGFPPNLTAEEYLEAPPGPLASSLPRRTGRGRGRGGRGKGGGGGHRGKLP